MVGTCDKPATLGFKGVYLAADKFVDVVDGSLVGFYYIQSKVNDCTAMFKEGLPEIGSLATIRVNVAPVVFETDPVSTGNLGGNEIGQVKSTARVGFCFAVRNFFSSTVPPVQVAA